LRALEQDTKEESVKRKGSSIIFMNDEGQILLFLRDNKFDLPYPNMWDVPGGHVETDESPENCIIREMKEEMDLVLDEFELFSKNECYSSSSKIWLTESL